MWYLEEYEKESQEFIQDYPLKGMDAPTLKEILDFDDSAYPIEAAEHPVQPAEMAELARFIGESFRIDESRLYFVGFHAD
ncbi:MULTISPECIES: DUF7683 domain-containing protein [Nocardia]|uniref:DUF7683 domain-containing protein n=1 Tax=Nocardia beijingensis TaxID=95162 RepID=A0ABW7WEI9_9NOCA|nr:hypothetical protein [Nocardia arthritidis]